MAQILVGLLIAALLEARWLSRRGQESFADLTSDEKATSTKPTVIDTFLTWNPLFAAVFVSIGIALCVISVVTNQPMSKENSAGTLIAVAATLTSLTMAPYLEATRSVAVNLRGNYSKRAQVLIFVVTFLPIIIIIVTGVLLFVAAMRHMFAT